MLRQDAFQNDSKLGTRKKFLVADLDNTIIDSRERFNRSIAAALRFGLTSTRAPVCDVKQLSGTQRNKFYEVFLSGRYMSLDVPVKGSVEVLSRLHSKRFGIIYLTGRHHSKEDSLKSETLESLARFGFPMPSGEDVMLYMKPRRMSPTSQYKRRILERLSRSLFLATGVDDEPDDLDVMTEFIPLTIGIALSSNAAKEILSKVRVPVAKDWFEVESIVMKNKALQ